MTAKDDRSRTILRLCVTGAMITTVLLIYTRAVAPLQEAEWSSQQRKVELQTRTAAARATIQAIKIQEQNSARAQAEVNRRYHKQGGAAVVWFPQRVKEYFDQSGIPNSVTRLNTTRDEPELPGYERTYRAVDIPHEAGAAVLGVLLPAVANIEEVEPTIRVMDVALRPSPEDPRRSTMVLNLSAVVAK